MKVMFAYSPVLGLSPIKLLHMVALHEPVCLQVYQDLCKKHPTFRERSENADLAVSFMAFREQNSAAVQCIAPACSP